MNAYEGTLGAFGASADLSISDPASSHGWAAWQHKWLRSTAVCKLALTGNQVGKTTVTAAEIVHIIRGTHPYVPRQWDGPINVIMVGESIEQLCQPGGPVEKLWSMLPLAEIDPRIRFEPGKGIAGTKYPVITFTDGPGVGSTITLRTYAQDPQSLSGATVHIVWCDEPPPSPTYSELQPRLLRNRGRFFITFTATESMPDQKWLRDLVDTNVFELHQVPLTEANTWIEGCARPLLDQSEIDDFAKRLPAHQVAMRVGASWEAVVTERWLSAWEDRFIRLERAPPGAFLVVGIDYGLKPGKQAAMLIAITDRDARDAARVWYMDECGGSGTSTIYDDAAEIIRMLERNGLTYDDVDAWVGDRPTGEGYLLKSKSNGDMKKALAKAIKRSLNEVKWIDTPTKNRTSVERGLGLMNELFAREAGTVSPRCKRFAEACAKFRGGKTDEHKDIIDAGRYAVEYAMSGALLRYNSPIKLSKWG